MSSINFTKILDVKGSITSIAIAPGEPDNIYIIQQKGIIINHNLVTQEEFIFFDMTDEISKVYKEKPMALPFPDERGLLRMVFHPDYNTNGSLFEGVFILIHSVLADSSKYDDMSRKEILKPNHMTCIAQYVHKDRYGLKWKKNTRINILCVPEPQANHNGGGMVFGSDNYLWIGLGDGGGANDEHGDLLNKQDKSSYLGNAQNLQSYHGKILRLEVVQPMPQNNNPIIPQDNPFVRIPEIGRPAIVAWGFRNPWSMSFDSKGRLFVGDVGQNRFESVKLVENMEENHGWRAYEGYEVFNKDVLKYIDEQDEDIILPILSYPRKLGVAIVGVQFYEGKTVPSAKNTLIFADHGGNIFQGMEKNKKWTMKVIKNIEMRIHGMGVDSNGEIYILGFDSKKGVANVFKMKGNMIKTNNPHNNKNMSLTDSDIQRIIKQGTTKAKRVKSAFRKNNGDTHVKMHFAVIRKGEKQAKLVHSMVDAWNGSKDIAIRKAYTAFAFSSNENALTSRTIGILSQPGQPLWQIGNSNPIGGIIEFPGGLPLYKNGKLVGGVGVSGDAVDQDETVAAAAAIGFEANSSITSQTVVGAPYISNPAPELSGRKTNPGHSHHNPHVTIVGREQWKMFDISDSSDIMLFISGDRQVTNLNEFKKNASQFVSMNFFATRLSSLAGLSTFKNLKVLNVSRTSISNLDMRQLSNMTQLTRLELNGNDIDSVTSISKLIHLIKLGLACTGVKSLVPLKNMKKLEILDIYLTGVNNVNQLKPLTSLKDIDIRETELDYKDVIKVLSKLKTVVY